MPMTELFAIGRDAVLRQAGANKTSVLDVALACQYGRQKNPETGRYPSQWYEGTLWGARAESLAPLLVKGARVVVTMEHIHLAPGRDKGDGTAYPAKLKGEIIAIGSIIPPRAAGDVPAAAPRAAPPPRPAPPPVKTGFDDMDDDIPF